MATLSGNHSMRRAAPSALASTAGNGCIVAWFLMSAVVSELRQEGEVILDAVDDSVLAIDSAGPPAGKDVCGSNPVVRTMSFTNFEMTNGSITVEVTSLSSDISACTIRPKSYGIERFTLLTKCLESRRGFVHHRYLVFQWFATHGIAKTE